MAMYVFSIFGILILLALLTLAGVVIGAAILVMIVLARKKKGTAEQHVQGEQDRGISNAD